MADDLNLSDLSMYYGTEQYHKIAPSIKTVVTDGVSYIMNNGYSRFVTDTLIKAEDMIKTKQISNEESEFLVFKLHLDTKNQAVVTIEDGNNKIFHEQKYEYTNAKKELVLFLTDGVLMLSNEY
jgi:hypothetical protein